MDKFDKILVGNTDDTINEIIHQNKIRRFASELNDIQNTNIERSNDVKKIISLMNRNIKNETNDLNDVNGTNKITENKTIEKKTKLSEIYEKINNDTLHSKWSKLSIPQQKNRIKEYLKSTIVDLEKQKKAENLLFNLIESQKIKKNAVTYDTDKSQVTGIFIKEYQEIIQENESSESTDSN